MVGKPLYERAKLQKVTEDGGSHPAGIKSSPVFLAIVEVMSILMTGEAATDVKTNVSLLESRGGFRRNRALAQAAAHSSIAGRRSERNLGKTDVCLCVHLVPSASSTRFREATEDVAAAATAAPLTSLFLAAAQSSLSLSKSLLMTSRGRLKD